MSSGVFLHTPRPPEHLFGHYWKYLEYPPLFRWGYESHAEASQRLKKLSVKHYLEIGNNIVAIYSQPMILPLNPDGSIYVLQDENGRIIGTGDRAVCAVLLEVMKKANTSAPFQAAPVVAHGNVRSAITL